MKSLIMALAFLAASGAHAEIGPCAAKVKAFSEKLALDFLDIAPAGENTSIEPAGKNSVKVTLINSSGTRIRTLIVHQGPDCAITGVESPDVELGSRF